MITNVCIYHDKCLDGFAAAWAVRAYSKRKNELDNWRFVPSVYGTSLPDDLHDKNIYIVDFSYKRSVMLELLEIANEVTILDHHSTAFKEIGDLVAEGTIKGVLDSKRSGCVIAWEYFNAPTLMPQLFKNIQDRDLWKFEDPRTKQVTAALEIQPRTFAAWDKLFSDSNIYNVLGEEGVVINKMRTYYIAALMNHQQPMCIGGHVVSVLNAPYFLASDIGNILAKLNPYVFAATYHDGAEKRIFSLRSTAQGVNVAKIAEQYGGGGHMHAAGFSIDKKWCGEPLPIINEVV